MSDQHNSTPKSQGLSIAALVLGIISIVTALTAFFSIIAGLLAVVFGAVSLKSAGRKKAIAGLITGIIGIVLSIIIILGVQVGLSSLQGRQRDSVRKSEVSSLIVDVANYQASNQGSLPAASDLSTVDFSYITSVNTQGEATVSEAVYLAGTNCDDEMSARNYSVTILLESGSVYCLGS